MVYNMKKHVILLAHNCNLTGIIVGMVHKANIAPIKHFKSLFSNELLSPNLSA